MLVRKLKAGDRLTIGEGIFLDCLKVGPSALRLAIKAPDGVILTVTAMIDREDSTDTHTPPTDYNGRG